MDSGNSNSNSIPYPTPSEGSAPSHYSHKGEKVCSYTVAFKLEVIMYAEQSTNHAAGRRYNVSRSCVRDWRKKKQQLQEMMLLTNSGAGRRRLNGGGRKIVDASTERTLVDWVLERKRQGLGTSGTLIIKKAHALQNERGEGDSAHALSYSRGWLEKFLKRNNISLKNSNSSNNSDINTPSNTNNSSNNKNSSNNSNDVNNNHNNNISNNNNNNTLLSVDHIMGTEGRRVTSYLDYVNSLHSNSLHHHSNLHNNSNHNNVPSNGNHSNFYGNNNIGLPGRSLGSNNQSGFAGKSMGEALPIGLPGKASGSNFNAGLQGRGVSFMPTLSSSGNGYLM